MRTLLLTVALTMTTLTTARAASSACDRVCMTGFITQYLDAMVAHKPSAAPLRDKVRFTEDTVDMKVGEGLWKQASKIRGYRQYIIDAPQGVAGSQVIMEEAGSPVMLRLRLKVVDKKITEIETQVTRKQSEGALFAIDALQTANPLMSVAPDKLQVESREDAIKTAMFYPAGLKIGSFE